MLEFWGHFFISDAGTHGGFPLHQAAKRGLDKTVLLLLSRGGELLPFVIDNRTFGM